MHDHFRSLSQFGDTGATLLPKLLSLHEDARRAAAAAAEKGGNDDAAINDCTAPPLSQPQPSLPRASRVAGGGSGIATSKQSARGRAAAKQATTTTTTQPQPAAKQQQEVHTPKVSSKSVLGFLHGCRSQILSVQASQYALCNK